MLHNGNVCLKLGIWRLTTAIIITLLLLSTCNIVSANDNPNQAPRRSQSLDLSRFDNISKDEVFYVDKGYDLDQYLYHNHYGSITNNRGYLEFRININRYAGPIDTAGIDRSLYPHGGNLTNTYVQTLKDMGASVTLKMYVYDVDNDYAGTAKKPEVDELSFNGEPLGNIESGDGKWKELSFDIPLDKIIFPDKGGKVTGITPAENLIRIAIDTANPISGGNNWAVTIDWAYLEFKNFPRPIVFIHGKGDNSLSWKIYNSNGHKDLSSGGWYKWFEDAGFPVGAVDVWSEGDPNNVMYQSVVYTDHVSEWGIKIHDGDWLDNNGNGEVDEAGERNVNHSTSIYGNTIPSNDYAFSDMLLTSSTTNDFTAYSNMRGVLDIGKMYGVNKVNFISHSTGAFYGRKYITEVMNKKGVFSNYPNYPEVDKFIMISGPNSGVDFGLWDSVALWANSSGSCIIDILNMSPIVKFYKDKVAEFNLQNNRNQKVKYYTIGGYSGWISEDTPDPVRPYWDVSNWDPKYNTCLQKQAIEAYQRLEGKYGVNWENETNYEETVVSLCIGLIGPVRPCLKQITLTHIPNDGLCTIKSMSLGGYETNIKNFALAHHNVRASDEVKSSVYNTLLPNANLKSSLAVKALSVIPPNVPENLPQYTYLNSSISTSTEKNDELMILGGSAIIHLLWDSSIGNLNIEVTDPNGVIITAGDISINQGDITVIPSAFVGGKWKFKITSGNLAKNVDYRIMAYMGKSDIKLNLATERYDYTIGDVVKVTAKFVSQSGPITGATVSANIYKINDNSLLGNINLYDDGTHGDLTANDGIYTNSGWIPSQKGKERFEITAVIKNDGLEFYRQAANIMINVLEVTSTFNTPNSDKGIDTNGNGKYDTLEITIGVTVPTAGTYDVGAELYDSNNKFISSLVVEASLNSGANSVKLSFDGLNIFNNKVDGSYYLKNGTISKDNELLAIKADVYTSNAYKYLDFETSKIYFSGTQSDEGVDTNANGKYDVMKWNYNLTVITSNTYSISATLKTATGKTIEIVNDSKSLSAGENALSLNFTGTKIRGTMENGPYIITDVSIYGPDGSSLSLSNVYTTTNYDYTSFEASSTPDLSVYSNGISFKGGANNIVTISGIVNNAGSIGASNFKVEAYLGAKGSGTLIGQTTILSLNKDESVTVELPWDISALAKTKYLIYLYVNNDHSVTENDYINNTAYKTADLQSIIYPTAIIPLLNGWNLISIPVQPDNTSVSSVFSSLSGSYSSIWTFQNGLWQMYDLSNPGFSDLTVAVPGNGYWLNMAIGGKTFSVTGQIANRSINLIAGWNLVGYNAITPQSVETAATSIILTNFESIWGFTNGVWQMYDPANPGFSDLASLEPGKGYWIKAKQAGTWTLP